MLSHRPEPNDPFSEFVRGLEPRLRDALSASLGSDAGREATAEAPGYAWEHWAKVREMDNPTGYLYVLGRDRGRRQLRRNRLNGHNRVVSMPVDGDRVPWVEPKLPGELAGLPEKQRVVVTLRPQPPVRHVEGRRLTC